MKNEMKMEFDAISANESFARVAVAAFVSELDPTLEEISDIKTAVSEAVTNAIIHGYDGLANGKVKLHCLLEGDVIHIEVADEGKGIADVEQAMEPLFTTKPELNRSGMGFPFMEAFMDDLEVVSGLGEDAPLPLDAPTLTAEDFSFYQRRVPGLFFLLGVGDTPELHSPEFCFDDETVLPQGVEFLKRLLLLE